MSSRRWGGGGVGGLGGAPTQHLQQLGLLAGLSGHSLPAGTALGPPQPWALSGDSAPPQAPTQGLFR